MKYKKSNQPVLLRSIVLLTFISIAFGFADSFYSFLIPIQLQVHHNSLILIGIFLCLASVFGLSSDIILGFISSKINYLVFLAIGISLTAIVPILFIIPETVLSIIILMIIWGIYHEFIKIAFFNYSARYKQASMQSEVFGIIYQFYEFAYIIGPFFAAFMLARSINTGYSIILIPIALALVAIRILHYIHTRYEKPYLTYTNKHPFGIRHEIKNLKKTYKKSIIPLFGFFIYNVWGAYIWTVIPLHLAHSSSMDSALLIGAFTLPFAFMQIYGGKIADTYGRNITSIIGLTIGSIATLIYGLQAQFAFQLILAFISCCGFAIANPAILGQLSFKAQNTSENIGETAGLQRISSNLGYIVGPLLAGIFAMYAGITASFTILGLILVISTIIMNIFLTHIHISGLLKKKLIVEYDM